MNPIVLDLLGVLTRSVLLALTGYLQKQHLLTPEMSANLVTVLMAHFVIWGPGAVAVGWGLWKSWWSRKKLLVAQASPFPMTENEVKAVLNSGQSTPSVSTPKNAVPGIPA